MFDKNDENCNCEPGMHVRSLLLSSLVLRDLAKKTGKPEYAVEAEEVKDNALVRRRERCNIDPAEPWESDEDMNSLVEPDFR